MGLESTARAWALQHGLQRSRAVVAAYRGLARVRFRGSWDEPVAFRGHHFRIGQDLTLYPAVHSGGFEAEELDTLLPLVPEDATVWDVGANIGIYAVLLGAAAHRGRVEAFEPVPATHQRLVDNVAANHVTNVRTHFVALSDSVGTARMAVHPDAHGCDQIGGIDLEPGVESIDVPTTTGEEFLRAHGGADPDVVKVDIEGHEPQFLAGAWGMFERRRPLLMMEVNPTAWTSAEQVRLWQSTMDDLFALYGTAQWFEATTPREVTSLDVAALEDTRAYTVLFTGRPR
ncbi:FkbM family methyltransferase [Nocardioides zeicaulis]|uniref:FkbM family methyltransferase n=1 Tax=Nocardioides zeicaulis TaxID=1776857 RepID=A0ABV6DYF2_9ACTN